MARPDPHSHFDDSQPRTESWDLKLKADFGRRVLEGSITLRFGAPGEGPLDLDTRGLDIRGARTPDGAAIPFDLQPEAPILGSRLRLHLPAGTAAVTVDYATRPDSEVMADLQRLSGHGNVTASRPPVLKTAHAPQRQPNVVVIMMESMSPARGDCVEMMMVSGLSCAPCAVSIASKKSSLGPRT